MATIEANETRESMRAELARTQQERGAIKAALINAIMDAGFHVSGPTDHRAAENGEPRWVCNARAALAKVRA